jgi:NitT/TauT family transport system permease protein
LRRASALWIGAQRFTLPVLGLAGAIVVWQVLGELHWLGLWVEYISSPTGAAQAGWNLTTSGELVDALATSFAAFALGFAIAALIGVPVGLLMGWSRLVREILEPLVSFFYAIPRLALMPIIVVWLGVGLKTIIVVVVIDAVIPVIINGAAGVRNLDAKLSQVALSFGASQSQLFWKILLPGATPAIITGLRLAIARSVLGVIVAQIYASVSGVGQLIVLYGQVLAVDEVVFLVLLVGMFGLLASLAVKRFERRFETWRGAS